MQRWTTNDGYIFPLDGRASRELMLEQARAEATWLSRAFAMTTAVIAGGVPSLDVLGAMSGAAASLGFRPVVTMWSGVFPAIGAACCFVDPTGATVLQYYRRSRSVYMSTYLSDGAAITHTTNPDGGGNLNTTYLPLGGDLAAAYRAHRELVQQTCRERGVRPVKRDTVEGLKAGWAHYHHTKVARAQQVYFLVSFLCINAMLLHVALRLLESALR